MTDDKLKVLVVASIAADIFPDENIAKPKEGEQAQAVVYRATHDTLAILKAVPETLKGTKIELPEYPEMLERVRGVTTALAPHIHTPEVQAMIRLGGSGPNIVRGFDGLASARLVSTTGTGPIADVILNRLEEAGISSEFVQRNPLFRTVLTYYGRKRQRGRTGLVDRNAEGITAVLQPLIDWERIEKPNAVIFAWVMPNREKNLANLQKTHPDVPVTLVCTTATTHASVGEIERSFARVHEASMNTDELKDILKKYGYVKEDLEGTEKLARAATRLARSLRAGGLLTATGGSGETILVAQSGETRILPSPIPCTHAHTTGAGDTFNALFKAAAHHIGVDLAKPGADMDKIERAGYAARAAMYHYVREGHLPHKNIAKYIEEGDRDMLLHKGNLACRADVWKKNNTAALANS